MLKPRQFGRYVLIDRISTGGMAEVYLAKSSGVQGFEKVVAIKRILPTVSEDPDFETMFIDEAKISAQLAHSNIGQVFEFGEVEGQYYIAMEYIPGKDLRAIQTHLEETDRVMDVPMALHIISRLCQALDYAHRQKDVEGRSMEIIHRDISPPNVIVSFEGSIKLIDFGIAKATSRATRTRAGKLKGKFAYMSPEQVQGMALDHRSDIFSVGTLLHELLTNRRLFQGDSQLAVMQAVRRAEVDPPSTINPEVPLDVDQIVLKALSRDRQQRYGWASELRADIERYFARSASLFEIQQLARWMQAEFAGDILAERHLQERLHTVQPQAASAADAAVDEKETPAELSIEPVEKAPAADDLGVTAEADALAGLPMTDKQTALPEHVVHEAETVRHVLASELGRPELEAETVRHVLDTDRRQVPDTDRRQVHDTDRRQVHDTDRRAPDTDRRAPDTDRRTPVFQPVDGQLTDSAEPDDALAAPDQTPPDTSPMVIGPAGQKVRPELVNWPTEFGGEPSGPGVPAAEPEPEPMPEVDEVSLEAGPTQVEAIPPQPSGGSIAPGAFRDRAVVGGALEVDSNPDRAMVADAGDSDPAVEVGGIDGVLQTNEVLLRRQPAGRYGHISATQELSKSKAKSFTSAQVIIIAAGLTLVLAGLIATPLLVCNGSTSTSGGGAGAGHGGTIVVTSTPAAGCSVSLDSKPKGLLAPGETLSLPRVPAGQHVVQLTCAGFQPYSTSVEVHRAEVTFVEAPLKQE